MAAMLASVGLSLLAAAGISGFLKGLRIGKLHGISTTFRAGYELRVQPSMFLHHNGMASDAAVWRELQGLYSILGKMILWQSKLTVFLHDIATDGTAACMALLLLFLIDEIIDPAQPRCHPHRHLVGCVVACRLVD